MVASAPYFIFIFFETLLIPFTMDQYAWEDGKAVFIGSILTSCSALLSLGMYGLVGPLTRRFDERKIITIGGFFLFLGNIILIPSGDNDILVANCTEVSRINLLQQRYYQIRFMNKSVSEHDNITLIDQFRYIKNEGAFICEPGCPPIQEWCEDVPQLPFLQLICGMTLILIMGAISRAAPLGVYSKILGPNPQQLWMTLWAGLISISRIIGPIIITYLYTHFGTYWLFGFTSTLQGIYFLFYLLMYKWLVPMKALQDFETKHLDKEK